ncbi:MAG: NAD(P)/FAD-dependent oxidoreductase [Proteobacteria bacterium]|nr:NAD(P)/FAD-dependent oxidoreductase [Pseudomonadota bacterium]
MKQEFDVIVIGGGAAGLMCAMESGKRGRRTLVLEHANRIGKKILLSGGGRCNFTNLHATPANYLSSNPHFCKSALARYTPADFIAMVESHGIAWHEKKLGQLFCDDSAKLIVQMLADECRTNGVQVITRCAVDRVEKTGNFFSLETERGEYTSESLVIASGGLSFPTMGASDFGYRIARQFGLDVLPTRAALVPLTLAGDELALANEISGVSTECVAGNAGISFRENILFTHRGLSGPAILQISSYWKDGEDIVLDLLPGVVAADWLRTAKRERGRARLRNVLAENLPKRFVEEIEKRWFSNRFLAECPDTTLRELGEKLNAWQVTPDGSEGYRTAEVTLGGVNTDELSSKTMASKKVDGLFFIGEVVDVTGWLGGYNFQWAWASGWCAGQTT